MSALILSLLKLWIHLQSSPHPSQSTWKLSLSDIKLSYPTTITIVHSRNSVKWVIMWIKVQCTFNSSTSHFKINQTVRKCTFNTKLNQFINRSLLPLFEIHSFVDCIVWIRLHLGTWLDFHSWKRRWKWNNANCYAKFWRGWWRRMRELFE